jgi:hypothetical protein
MDAPLGVAVIGGVSVCAEGGARKRRVQATVRSRARDRRTTEPTDASRRWWRLGQLAGRGVDRDPRGTVIGLGFGRRTVGEKERCG